jgi:hypothetical protein
MNAVNAQIDTFLVKTMPSLSINSAGPVIAKSEKITFMCSARTSTSSEEPLLVIDGMPHEFNELQRLNPNDIASIEILKEYATDHIGCRPKRGVILITTKASSVRKFIIKDVTDSSIIPGATVSFVTKSTRINTAADNRGVVITDKLKKGEQYEMIVTSAGYKSLSASFENHYSEEKQIFLERDTQVGEEIFVVSRLTYGRGCPRGYAENRPPVESKTAEEKRMDKTPIKSLFPNPVQRNNGFNIEFQNEQDETMQLEIINLNGSLISLHSRRISKGLNRLSLTADAKWAAGIYIIQVRNEKGIVIKQEKLVVQ